MHRNKENLDFKESLIMPERVQEKEKENHKDEYHEERPIEKNKVVKYMTESEEKM